MAVTEPSRTSRVLLFCGLALLLCAHAVAQEGKATTGYMDRLQLVATSLSAGNAADAIAPFDPSYPQLTKLRDDFQALSTVQVSNEIAIADEQATSTEATLKVTWALTITDPGTNSSENRSADIQVRMSLKRGKWYIVEFAPISVFEPRLRQE